MPSFLWTFLMWRLTLPLTTALNDESMSRHLQFTEYFDNTILMCEWCLIKSKNGANVMNGFPVIAEWTLPRLRFGVDLLVFIEGMQRVAYFTTKLTLLLCHIVHMNHGAVLPEAFLVGKGLATLRKEFISCKAVANIATRSTVLVPQ